MSFLNKLKFWKKEDDFALPETNDMPDMGHTPGSMPDNLGLDRSTDKLADSGYPPQPSASQPVQQQYPQMPTPSTLTPSTPSTPMGNSSLDLISSKLDTIKAELDAMNQRIKNIEKVTEESASKKPPRQTVW